MTLEFDVGGRLKQLRQDAGLSQRQLAERANVPHGQISMIETNRSSPSVASLRKILGGLNQTMVEFFEPEGTPSDQVFFGENELADLTAQLYHGGTRAPADISLKQLGDATRHNLQILKERYAPGSDTGETLIEHEASEGGIVISGEIEITVGNEVRILKAGEGYLFDSRLPHRFRNISTEPCEVI